MQPDENAPADRPSAPDVPADPGAAESAPLTEAAAPPPSSPLGDPDAVQPSAPLAQGAAQQPSAPLAGAPAPLPDPTHDAAAAEDRAAQRRRGGLRALACLVVAGFFTLLVVTQDRGAGLEVLWGFLALVWAAMAVLALAHSRRTPAEQPRLDGIEDDDLAG